MRKFLKGLAWVAGVIAVLVLAARLLFFRVWTVPDDATLVASIAPTLHEGDKVLVLFRGDREIGDLVKCPHPEGGRWIVGRVYGQPGDKIQVDGNFVEINGRKYRTTESCLEDKVHIEGPKGVTHDLMCQRVDFGGGWHFIATEGGDRTPNDASVVAPDKIYLVSDNRIDSFDSRDYGQVPVESCKEKIVFRLWGKNGFFDSKGRFEYIR